MITLSINLPERYDLVSVQHMWNGTWSVCVCIRRPGLLLGEFYGLGIGDTTEEAAKRAVERSEEKQSHPERFVPPNLPKAKVDIDLKELGL